MNAYVNASDMRKAEKILKHMKLQGLQPNIVTYGTLIRGYASEGYVAKMMRKYEEMCGQQIAVSQAVFIIMLRALGKYVGLDRAMFWFKEMSVMGFQPDGRAHKILLELSIMKGRRGEVEELFDNLT
jgi:pentatricopeptide repeat protein